MMTILNQTAYTLISGLIRRHTGSLALIILCAFSTPTLAQEEIRYSWFEISFVGQDVDRMGTSTDIINQQTVDIHATDGDGVRFRGSVGTWNNFYAFFDFSSSDIDLTGTVTNPGGAFPATDEFDFTAIRGGFGYRYPINYKMDVYGELSYDSMDLDFGQFVDEEWDTSNKDVGGALGVRAMLNDDWRISVYGRYTSNGDVDLTSKEFDTDTVFGVGIGWQIVRGFSIVADYESGQFSSWSIGFRLDLDEN